MRSTEKNLRKFPLVLALLSLVSYTLADTCSCGYAQDANVIWTDSIETDFTAVRDIETSQDWAVQKWTSARNVSEAPYGRLREARNVVANPATGGDGSKGKDGSQAGLQLYVRSALEDDNTLVPVGEIFSKREDIQYGSFRAGIKPSTVNGTVSAFFWYRNATQEIDMELLSAETTANNSTLNMVLQSWQSLWAGSDASKTAGFKKGVLPFIADDAVHEYRFDWTPTSVSFYVDSNHLWTNTLPDFVPSSPGYLVLNHWSNGNSGWSRGPPKEDARVTVTYVKAYFNSTDPVRQRDFSSACRKPSSDSICQITPQAEPPICRKPGGCEGGTMTVSSAASTGKVLSAILISIIGMAAAWLASI